MPTFRYSSWIDAPVETVFGFHEQPGALDRLTPPGQKIEIVERTNGIQVGSRVVIRMRVGLFPVEWHALHTVYEKHRLFVDEQQKGLFRSWVHRHEFAEENSGTRLTDSITYRMKTGILAEVVSGWFVKLQLNRMFRWRHEVTKKYCEKKA